MTRLRHPLRGAGGPQAVPLLDGLASPPMADLPHRKLGELSVSVVGLGCNNFGRRVDLEGTRAVVDAALNAGINFLDTADIYGGQGGSEELLGQVPRGRRDPGVLATKVGVDTGEKGPSGRPRGSAGLI